MPHETTLIATIAVGLGLAFLFGFLAQRLRLPPLVGYLVAGVLVGPFTPGYVADTGLASQLAEIGVILLMFGVGLHFSLGDLLAVRRVAVPGALAHMLASAVVGALLPRAWGWPWGESVVFGVALSIASTVVLLRALEQRGLLDTADGRMALGWLIVEDLATVLVLVVLPALARPAQGGAPGNLWLAIALTVAKAGLFLVLMLVVGRRIVPWLLERVARTGSRELFTLATLAVALGVAVGAAALFGVSFALGAFFAGVVINESDLSYQAAADALPLQDAFAVLFFVSVGMLFDPKAVVRSPLAILEVVAIVVVVKSLLTLPLVLLFWQPMRTALTVSASLGQIGEFSFILAGLGISLGLMRREAQSLIVAGALLSIPLNQLLFAVIEPTWRWLHRHPRLLDSLERLREPDVALSDEPAESLAEHVVLVGHGRVGSAIAAELIVHGIPYVVIERDWRIVASLRASGFLALFGDAARPGILARAHLDRARLLIITTPDPFQTRQVLTLARQLNPTIDTVVRTHGAAEQAYLEQAGVGRVVLGEQELAMSMAAYILESLREPETIKATVPAGAESRRAPTPERR
jgi:CPA2 family monovalent cation:H+ antiporter-2